MINVVAGIIFKNEKILCARRKEGLHLAGHWEFPGGKVEKGETYKVSLARELKEELGINVSVGSYIGQSTFSYGEKVIRLHALLVDWIDGDLILNDHDEVKWLSLAELNSLMWAPADIPLINQLSTFLFYEKKAVEYRNETISFDISQSFQPFLKLVPDGGLLLDLGCGSGRDAKAFKEMGYQIVAMDPSPTMANLSKEYINEQVITATYFNMNFIEKFDGIWASASLLHCPKSEFDSVISNILLALKTGGVAYISLKVGDGEGLDQWGRYFSYWRLQELETFFSTFNEISDIKLWAETSELRGKSQEWINVLFTKRALND